MGNMSYCRFENTSNDLADCLGAITEMSDGEAREKLSSEYEREGLRRLVSLCQETLALLYADLPEPLTAEELLTFDFEDVLQNLEDNSTKYAGEDNDY